MTPEQQKIIEEYEEANNRFLAALPTGISSQDFDVQKYVKGKTPINPKALIELHAEYDIKQEGESNRLGFEEFLAVRDPLDSLNFKGGQEESDREQMFLALQGRRQAHKKMSSVLLDQAEDKSIPVSYLWEALNYTEEPQPLVATDKFTIEGKKPFDAKSLVSKIEGQSTKKKDQEALRSGQTLDKIYEDFRLGKVTSAEAEDQMVDIKRKNAQIEWQTLVGFNDFVNEKELEGRSNEDRLRYVLSRPEARAQFKDNLSNIDSLFMTSQSPLQSIFSGQPVGSVLDTISIGDAQAEGMMALTKFELEQEEIEKRIKQGDSRYLAELAVGSKSRPFKGAGIVDVLKSASEIGKQEIDVKFSSASSFRDYLNQRTEQVVSTTSDEELAQIYASSHDDEFGQSITTDDIQDLNNRIFSYYGGNALDSSARIFKAKLSPDDFVKNLYPNLEMPYVPTGAQPRREFYSPKDVRNSEKANFLYQIYEQVIPEDFAVTPGESIKPVQSSLSAVQVLLASTADTEEKKRLNLIGDELRKRSAGQSLIDTTHELAGQNLSIFASSLLDPQAMSVTGTGLITMGTGVLVTGFTGAGLLAAAGAGTIGGLGIYAVSSLMDTPIDDVMGDIEAAAEQAREELDGKDFVIRQPHRFMTAEKMDFNKLFSLKLLELGYPNLSSIPYDTLKSDLTSLNTEQEKIRGQVETTQVDRTQYRVAAFLDNYTNAKLSNLAVGDLPPETQQLLNWTGSASTPISEVLRQGPLEESDQIVFNRSLARTKSYYESHGFFTRGLGHSLSQITLDSRYDSTTGMVYVNMNTLGKLMMATAATEEMVAEADISLFERDASSIGFPKQFDELTLDHPFIAGQASDLNDVSALDAYLFQTNIVDFLAYLPKRKEDGQPNVRSVDHLEELMQKFEVGGTFPFAKPVIADFEDERRKDQERRRPINSGALNFLGRSLVVSILNPDSFTVPALPGLLSTPYAVRKSLREQNIKGMSLIGEEDLTQTERVIRNANTSSGWLGLMAAGGGLNMVGLTSRDEAVQAAETMGIIAGTAAPDPTFVAPVAAVKGISVGKAGLIGASKARSLGLGAGASTRIGAQTALESIGPRSKAFSMMWSEKVNGQMVMPDQQRLVRALEETRLQAGLPREGEAGTLRSIVGDETLGVDEMMDRQRDAVGAVVGQEKERAGTALTQSTVLALAGAEPITGFALAGTWWATKSLTETVSKKLLEGALPTTKEITDGNLSALNKVALSRQYYLDSSVGQGSAAGAAVRAAALTNGYRAIDGFYRGKKDDGKSNKNAGTFKDLVDGALKNFGLTPKEIRAMTETYLLLAEQEKGQAISYLLNRGLEFDSSRRSGTSGTIDGVISEIVHSNSFADLKKNIQVKVNRKEMTQADSDMFLSQVTVLAFAFPKLKKSLLDGTFISVLEADSNLSGKKIINVFNQDIEVNSKAYPAGSSIPKDDAKTFLNSMMTNAEQRYWRSRGLFDFIEQSDSVDFNSLQQWMEQKDEDVFVSPSQRIIERVSAVPQEKITDRPTYNPFWKVNSLRSELAKPKKSEDVIALITEKLTESEAEYYSKEGLFDFIRGQERARIKDIDKWIDDKLDSEETTQATQAQSFATGSSARNILDLTETQENNIFLNEGRLHKNSAVLEGSILVNGEKATDPILELKDGDVVELREKGVVYTKKQLELELPLNKLISKKIQGREGQWLTTLGPKQAEQLILGETVEVWSRPRRAEVFVNDEKITDPTIVPSVDDKVELRIGIVTIVEGEGLMLHQSLELGEERAKQLIENNKTITNISSKQSGVLIEADVVNRKTILPKRIQIVAHRTAAGKLRTLEQLIAAQTEFKSKKTRTKQKNNYLRQRLVELITDGTTDVDGIKIEAEIFVDGQKASDPNVIVKPGTLIDVRFSDIIAPQLDVEASVSQTSKMATIGDVVIEFNVVDRQDGKSIEIKKVQETEEISLISESLIERRAEADKQTTRELEEIGFDTSELSEPTAPKGTQAVPASPDKALKAIDALVRHHLDQGDVRRFRIDRDAVSPFVIDSLEESTRDRDRGTARRRGATVRRDDKELKFTYSLPYVQSILAYQGKVYTGNTKKITVVPDQRPLGRLSVDIPEGLTADAIVGLIDQKAKELETLEQQEKSLRDIATEKRADLKTLSEIRDQVAAEEHLLGIVGRDYESEKGKGRKLDRNIIRKINFSRLSFLQQIARQAIKARKSLGLGLELHNAFIKEMKRSERQIAAKKAELTADILEGFHQLEYLGVAPEGLNKAREAVEYEGASAVEVNEVFQTNSGTTISRGATSSERIYSRDGMSEQISAEVGEVDGKDAVFVNDIYSETDPVGLRYHLLSRHYQSLLDSDTTGLFDADEAIKSSSINLLNLRFMNPTNPLRIVLRDVIRDKNNAGERFEVIGVPSQNIQLTQAVAKDLQLMGVTYRLEKRRHPSGLVYDVYFTNVGDEIKMTERLAEATEMDKSFGTKDFDDPVSKRWLDDGITDLRYAPGFELEFPTLYGVEVEDLNRIKDESVRLQIQKTLSEDRDTVSLRFDDETSVNLRTEIDSNNKLIFVFDDPIVRLSTKINTRLHRYLEMVKFAAGEGADFVVIKPEESTYTTVMPYVRQALSDLADRWGAKVDQDGLRIEITDEMKLSVPEGTNLFREPKRVEAGDLVESARPGEEVFESPSAPGKVIATTPFANHLNALELRKKYLEKGLYSSDEIENFVSIQNIRDIRQINLSGQATLSDLVRSLGYVIESMIDADEYAELVTLFDSAEVIGGQKVLTRRGELQLAEAIRVQQDSPSLVRDEGKRRVVSKVISVLDVFNLTRHRINPNPADSSLSATLGRFDPFAYADRVTAVDQSVRLAQSEAVQNLIHRRVYTGVDAVAKVAEDTGFLVKDVILDAGSYREKVGVEGEGEDAKTSALYAKYARDESISVNQEILNARPSAWGDHLDSSRVIPERKRAKENIVTKQLEEELNRPPTKEEVELRLEERGDQITPSGSDIDVAFFQLVDEGKEIDVLGLFGRVSANAAAMMVRNDYNVRTATKYVPITARTIAREEEQELYIARSANELYKIFGRTSDELGDMARVMDVPDEGSYIPLERLANSQFVPAITFKGEEALEIAKRLTDVINKMDASPINMSFKENLRKRIYNARYRDQDLVITVPEISNDIREALIDLASAHLSYRNNNLETAYVRPIQKLLLSTPVLALGAAAAVAPYSPLVGLTEQVGGFLTAGVVALADRKLLKTPGGRETIDRLINQIILDATPKFSIGAKDRETQEAANEFNRSNQALSDELLVILQQDASLYDAAPIDQTTSNLSTEGRLEMRDHYRATNEIARRLRRQLNTPVSLDHLSLLQEIVETHIKPLRITDESSKPFLIEGLRDQEGRVTERARKAVSVMRGTLEDSRETNKLFSIVESSLKKDRLLASSIAQADDAFEQLKSRYREEITRDPETIANLKGKNRDLYFKVMYREINTAEQSAFEMIDSLPDSDLSKEQRIDYETALNTIFIGLERRYNRIEHQGRTIYTAVTGKEIPDKSQDAFLAYNLFFKGRLSRLDSDYRVGDELAPPTPMSSDPEVGFTKNEIARIAQNNGIGKAADISAEATLKKLKIEMEKAGRVYNLDTSAGRKEAVDFAVSPTGDHMVLFDLDKTRGVLPGELERRGEKQSIREANVSSVALEIIVRFMAEENFYDFCDRITKNYLRSKGIKQAKKTLLEDSFSPISMEAALQEEVVNQVKNLLDGSNMTRTVVEDGRVIERRQAVLNDLERSAAIIAEDIIATYQLTPKDTKVKVELITLPDGQTVPMPEQFHKEMLELLERAAPVGRARTKGAVLKDDQQMKVEQLQQALIMRSRIINEASERLITELGMEKSEAENAVKTYIVQNSPEYIRANRQELFELNTLMELNDEISNKIRESEGQTKSSIRAELQSSMNAKFNSSKAYRNVLFSAVSTGTLATAAGMGAAISAPVVTGVVLAAALSGYFGGKVIQPLVRRTRKLDSKVSAFLDLEYALIEADSLAGRLQGKMAQEKYGTTFDPETGRFNLKFQSIGKVIGAIVDNQRQRAAIIGREPGFTKTESFASAVDLFAGVGAGGLLGLVAAGGPAAVFGGGVFGGLVGMKYLMRKVKTAVTVGMLVPTPAYFVANFIGAFYQAYTSVGISGLGSMISFAASNPRFFKEVMTSMHGQIGSGKSPDTGRAPLTFVTKDGRIYTPETFVREANTFGIGSSFVKAELAQTLQEDLERSSPGSTKRIIQEMGLLSWRETMVDFTQSLDNVFRVSMYMKEIGEGASSTTAAQRVRDAFYDYGDLTEVERQILRQVVLFYAFLRKNQAQITRVMLENPDRIARQIKFGYRSQQRALYQEEDTEEIAVEQDVPRIRETGFVMRPELYLSSFYQNRTYLPAFKEISKIVGNAQQDYIYEDIYGGRVYFGPMLPAMDGVKLWLDFYGIIQGDDQAFNSILGMAVPPAQLAIGEVTDKVLFGDRPYEKVMLDERMVFLFEDLTMGALFGPEGSGAYVE